MTVSLTWIGCVRMRSSGFIDDPSALFSFWNEKFDEFAGSSFESIWQEMWRPWRQERNTFSMASRVFEDRWSNRRIVDKPKWDCRERKVDRAICWSMGCWSIVINCCFHRIVVRCIDAPVPLTFNEEKRKRWEKFCVFFCEFFTLTICFNFGLNERKRFLRRTICFFKSQISVCNDLHSSFNL